MNKEYKGLCKLSKTNKTKLSRAGNKKATSMWSDNGYLFGVLQVQLSLKVYLEFLESQLFKVSNDI